MTIAKMCAAGIGLAPHTTVALAAVGRGLVPNAGGAHLIGDTCDASACRPLAGFRLSGGLAAGVQVRPAAIEILVVPVAFDNPASKSPEKMLNALADPAGALYGCWGPPSLTEVADPPNVIFQVSDRRNGTPFGRPASSSFPAA
jgi:hypothetical protein